MGIVTACGKKPGIPNFQMSFFPHLRYHLNLFHSSFSVCHFFIAPTITPEEEWEAMLPEVTAAARQILQPLQEDEDEEVLEVEETAEGTSEQITGMLRKLNYK